MKKQNVLLVITIIIVVLLAAILIVGYYKKSVEKEKRPLVTMEIEDYGQVQIELYPEQAPQTVANFINLINEGFYNGLTFHRAIDNTLIQGGDKDGTGSGESEYTIKGEFLANGHENTLRHEAGTISMARADYSNLSPDLIDEGYNSAATQFFVMLNTQRYFDGLYAAFGKVISGLDIIQKISELETKVDEEVGETETIAEPPVIKSMTVETYGVDYGKPDKLEPFDYYTWMLNNYNYVQQ